MTEKTQATVENKPDEKSKTTGNQKREKCRPMTKVVIRRLPPSMTQEQFIEQVSPLPEHDYLYFAKANLSLGLEFAFSRAYIDFKNQSDIFLFREKFDNYVFVDAKGTEFPGVVEFAPFQRIPKKRPGKKKDLKCGTIESDPYYISFLESLKNQDQDATNGQPKTEYSFQPSDLESKKVTTTPLLHYLKQKKLERQRIRDEKREEKRRRDLERKRNKDEAAAIKITKVLDSEKTKAEKEDKEKSSQKNFNRTKPKKEERFKDKPPKERDSKPNPSKSQSGKKFEDRKNFAKKDDQPKEPKDELQQSQQVSTNKERKGKSYEKMRLEKKRQAEALKKNLEAAAKEEKIEIKESRDAEKDLTECCRRLTQMNVDDISPKNQPETSSGNSPKNRPKTNIEENPKNRTRTGSDETLDLKFTKKLHKRRSSLESGEKVNNRSRVERSGSGSGSNGNQKNDNPLRRHKSLDGENDRNLRKNEDKDKKDPRMERRIRNKDRPAMEIYRPGMGKFSKQRMEREKGSEEKVTPSQSPTRPTGRATKAEVRTMTFKRSVSRDYS